MKRVKLTPAQIRNARRALLVSMPSEPMRKFEEMVDGIGSWTVEALQGLAAAMKLASVNRASDRITFELTADDGGVRTVEIHCDEDESDALVTRLMFRAARQMAADLAGAKSEG